VPELPEIETIRRLLSPVLEGRRFEYVEILDPRLTAPIAPIEVAAELEGDRIAALERRGKYLLVRLASGATLVVHLRMSGSLRHDPAGALPDDPYRRAVARLDDGSVLAYRDVRRLGKWALLAPDELSPFLDRRLGPEPLDPGFTARKLGARLGGRRTSLKAAILDQRTLAGVGNIYADEALWWARLHPAREAGSLAPDELRALHRAIRRVLEQGIAYQGSTLRDYALPNGAPGAMQREFKVYGRAGEPCERCGTPIEWIRLAGRGTSYCPHCQPLRPGAASAGRRAV
jgi:formamidopyrimidine-DNA glycosylase